MAGARTRNTVTPPSELDPPRAAGTAGGRTGGTTGTAGGPATAAPAGGDPPNERDTRGATPRQAGRRGRIATLVALVAVLLVAMTLAVWFRGEAEGLHSRADTNNAALVNAQATAQVDSEISAALETVYSYDHTKLDANQAAAAAVITGRFTEDYRTLFAEVRELAPQQQAVVSASVVKSAVKVLDDGRAVLIVFLNQRGTKGTNGEQIAAAGRLTVTAQQVDGQWKIAAVQNL